MDAQTWIREHLLLDAHCDSLILRLRRDDPLDLADADPVYQVDLPLVEGRYSWSEGKYVEVFDSTVQSLEMTRDPVYGDRSGQGRLAVVDAPRAIVGGRGRGLGVETPLVRSGQPRCRVTTSAGDVEVLTTRN